MRDRPLSTSLALMSYCGQTTLATQIIGTPRRIAKVLYCRTWSCPDCAPRRRAQLIAQGIGGQPQTFLTLTMRADYPGGPIEQAKALNAAWRTLRQAIARRWKLKGIPHLAVIERTKEGVPHLHILARLPYIPQKWISQKMAAYIGSPIIDIRRIDKHRNVASYVAKYIGKEPHQFGTCKRYYRSRDYELREDRKGKRPPRPWLHHWRLTQRLSMVRDYWLEAGYVLTLDTATAIIAEWQPPP